MYVIMIVAENEIIHIMLSIKGFREFIQWFIHPSENIFTIMRQTIGLRPAVAKTESDPRVEHAEKELSHPVMEESAQEAVT